MNAFAAISGDRNPLHLDEAFAEERGFPGRVVFGHAHRRRSTRSSSGCTCRARFALLHGIDVEFKSPAFVGDRLIVAGEIVHPERRVPAARDQGVDRERGRQDHLEGEDSHPGAECVPDMSDELGRSSPARRRTSAWR